MSTAAPRAAGEHRQTYDSVRAWARGPVGGITLDLHERRNAIGPALADDFVTATDWLAGAGVVVSCLAAEGTTFCAGADLAPALDDSPVPPVTRVLRAMERSGMTWISSVQGPVVGAGIAVALASPVVVAAEHAWFGLPELSALGRVPVGVLDSIVGKVGIPVGIRLAVLEDRITAREALAAGWISAVTTAEDLDHRVRAVAQRLAGLDPANRNALVRRWRAAVTATAPGGGRDVEEEVSGV